MKTKSHSISGAFVFTLLGAFAVFSMLLVVLGAQAYRTTVDGASAHTRKRIAAAFVRNAVRAQEDGEPVCAAQAFEPTLEGDLLTIRVTDETGHVSTVYIARRCAQ